MGRHHQRIKSEREVVGSIRRRKRKQLESQSAAGEQVAPTAAAIAGLMRVSLSLTPQSPPRHPPLPALHHPPPSDVNEARRQRAKARLPPSCATLSQQQARREGGRQRDRRVLPPLTLHHTQSLPRCPQYFVLPPLHPPPFNHHRCLGPALEVAHQPLLPPQTPPASYTTADLPPTVSSPPHAFPPTHPTSRSSA